MRRLMTFSLAIALTGATASASHAQPMGQLPAGVTLRVATTAGTYTGVLASQSSDSVWLIGKTLPSGGRAVATTSIRTVDRAEVDYPKSMLLGGLVGAAVGSAIYFSHAQKDRGIVFGSSVTLGAVGGILVPRLRWVAVPLR